MDGFIICGGSFGNPFVGDDVGVINLFIGSEVFLTFCPPNLKLSRSMFTPATASQVVGFFDTLLEDEDTDEGVGGDDLLLLAKLLIGCRFIGGAPNEAGLG